MCNTESWKEEFIIDSGATSHMTANKDILDSWKPFNKVKYVLTSTGKGMMTMGRGDVLLYNHSLDADEQKIILKDVLYVPSLKHNLISLTEVSRKGYQVTFANQRVRICKQQTIITGNYKKGKYLLDLGRRPAEIEERAYQTISKFTEEQLSLIKYTPETWRDVKKDTPEVQDIWIQAMKEELNNFANNNTWKPEEPPKDIVPIHTRWIFKVKKNESNKVTKIRARLVGKGFEQQYGTQYEASYAPVIRTSTLRTLLVMAAHKDHYIRHIDVDSAFLYGRLKETIYVEIPESPPDMFQYKYYRLQAAIYGLKQASHEWYTRLKTSLKKLFFEPCDSDNCLFINTQSNQRYYIITHVDDILIIGPDKHSIDKIMKGLQTEYSIKDLGEVRCYLGIHIKKLLNPNRYMLHQKDKICKIIEDSNMKHCPNSKTPMIPDYLSDKTNDISEKMKDIKKYQQILGELLYLANTSRPDITLATGILGRSAHSPSVRDWQEMMRLVGYLGNNIDLTLILGDLEDQQLAIYSDADWGGDPHTRRSTSGGCIYYKGSPISWNSSRQKNITLSTAESEYVAATEVIKEATWIYGLMQEIGISLKLPLELQCDNQSTIAIISSMKTKANTKHIIMRIKYLRELVDSGFLVVKYCQTKLMIADIFTKPLPHPRHQLLTDLLMDKPRTEEQE